MFYHIQWIRSRTTCLRIEPLEQRTMLAAFNLANYEENFDINLTGTSLTDLSGIAYSDETDRLYIVNNDGQGDIVVFERDGTFVDEIDMDDFDDVEAIVHMGGDRFAVIEEANLGTEQDQEFHISIFSITDSSDIQKNSLDQDLPNEGVIVLTHANLNDGDPDNQGPEGLAYDAANGYFYFAKEDNFIRIFRVPDVGGTVQEVSVSTVTGPSPTELGDISDIYFTDEVGGAGGRLIVLSDEGVPGIPTPVSRAIMVDLAASGTSGTVVKDGGTTIDVDLPVDSFEGLGFTPDSFEMFVVRDGSDRRFQQYRNFTVFEADSPNLSSNSDFGVSSTDDITNDTTPEFTGTVAENSTVWLYVNGVQTGSPVNTDSSGNYTITATTLSAGQKTITIRVGESTSTPEAKRSPASDGLVVTIDTTAPKIERVTISGSDSNHAPFDFDDENPDMGTGKQLSTVPVGAADEIQLGFTEAIGMATGSAETLKAQLSIVGMVFDNEQAGSTASIDTSDADAPIWTFPSVFAMDQYELTVDDDIIDVAGNRLDGEWVNPDTWFDESTPYFEPEATISEFPSGNGTATGDFEFRFTILPGDFNRDNVIGYGDYVIMETNGPETGGTVSTFQQGDIDGDGNITNGETGDYGIFISPDLFGTILVVWDFEMQLGDLDIDLDRDFDDIDDFVDALSMSTGEYLANNSGSFPGTMAEDEDMITLIVTEAIANINDINGLDFDDIAYFVALLNGISGDTGQLLPSSLS